MQRRQYGLVLCAALIVICSGSVWGQRNLSGDPQLSEDFAQRATARLRGRVIWEDQDLSRITVQIYRDSTLNNLYTVVTQLQRGEFEIRVEPGGYYLVAFRSTNATR